MSRLKVGRAQPASAGIVAAWLALLFTSLSACTTDVDSLNFTTDERLTFRAPASRALIDQPVTLSWTILDFTIATPGQGPPSEDSGYFAIFVDRAPIKPGETLKAVASKDPSCLRTPGCPDAKYLRGLQIYTTTETSFELPTVADIPRLNESIQLHQATLVLLDAAGRRIGESAWTIEFKLRRRASG